jgi:hypothetical protein
MKIGLLDATWWFAVEGDCIVEARGPRFPKMWEGDRADDALSKMARTGAVIEGPFDEPE